MRCFRLRPQAVQPPHDDGIHFPPLGIRHEAVQGRSAVLGPADAVVNELLRRPASCLDVPPQLLELILGLLVQRRDARVDRGPGVEGGLHESTPRSWKLGEGGLSIEGAL